MVERETNAWRCPLTSTHVLHTWTLPRCMHPLPSPLTYTYAFICIYSYTYRINKLKIVIWKGPMGFLLSCVPSHKQRSCLSYIISSLSHLPATCILCLIRFLPTCSPQLTPWAIPFSGLMKDHVEAPWSQDTKQHSWLFTIDSPSKLHLAASFQVP